MAAKKLSSRSFLKHIKNNEAEAEKIRRSARRSLGLERRASGFTLAKHMNPSLAAKMLEVGFVKDANASSLFDREDVTAKMIFLLLLGGGLRQSEPLHMWFNDISFPFLDGSERCIPLLRHPSQASTYIVGENVSRRVYLIQRGLTPRHEATSKALSAGWKNLALEDATGQTEVYFIHLGIEYQFASYFKSYLNMRRELVAARISRGEADHPFLFVSRGEDRNSGLSCTGNPYSRNAFKKAWERALNRVEAAYGETVGCH